MPDKSKKAEDRDEVRADFIRPDTQPERRDLTEILPPSSERRQSLDGFDADYTDIVDYIVRCTHRIWDERDVGLIYTHYTHNCVVYTPVGTIHNREEVVQNTIKTLFAMPEKRGMATHVIWTGNDKDGFYTSHLVTTSGRHTQFGELGTPTGRTFSSRTVADCQIFRNRIHREWLVRDSMAPTLQLGLDPHQISEDLAVTFFKKGLLSIDVGENFRLIGQYPPESEPDTSIATTDMERDVLKWMHEVQNRRMFGRIRDVYAKNVLYHGPLMKELVGPAAVTHQLIGLYACFPDAAFMPQHICSIESDEGGTKVAVRWLMEGHHLGWGILHRLGKPTGKRIQIMGMTHLHVKNGRVVEEWTNYDEMSALMQIKLAQMADRDSAVLPGEE